MPNGTSPGTPNRVARNYHECDEAIRSGESYQTKEEIDPRSPHRARTEKRDEQDYGAVKDDADAASKMIRLQCRNSGSKDIRRGQRIRGSARKNQFVVQTLQRGVLLPLLCRVAIRSRRTGVRVWTRWDLPLASRPNRFGILRPPGSAMCEPI